MSDLAWIIIAALAVALWRMHGRIVRLEAAVARPDAVSASAKLAKPARSPTPGKTAKQATSAGRKSWNFEERLTQRWFVWLGGIIVAVGALFLVRAAADAGLAGPRVRLGTAGFCGIGAILFAEWLVQRTSSEKLNPLVPAALTASGLATLFAVIWASSALYGFIAPLAAFLTLAGLVLVALALAFRHGQMLAWLGLGGGLAAPYLAGGAGAYLTGLWVYLNLVFACAFVLSARQGWKAFAWALLPAIAFYPLFSIIEQLPGGPDGNMPLAVFLGIVGIAGLSLAQTSLHWQTVFQALLALLWLIVLVIAGFSAEPLAIFLSAMSLMLVAIHLRRIDQAWSLVMPVAGIVWLFGIELGPMAWEAFGKVTAPPDLWNAAAASLRPLHLDSLVRYALGLAVVFVFCGLRGIHGAMRPGFWSVMAGLGPVLILAVLYLRLSILPGMQTPLAWAILAWASATVLLAGYLKKLRLPTPLAAMTVATIAAMALLASVLLTQSWLPLALCFLAFACVELWRLWRIRTLLLAAPWLGWAAALFALMAPGSLGVTIAGADTGLWTLISGMISPALILIVASMRIRIRPELASLIARTQLASLIFVMLAIGHGASWLAQFSDTPALVEAGLRAAAWIATLAWLVAYARETRLFWPAALAHIALITCVALPVTLNTQNPLIHPVGVGVWPLANLLLPGYGLPALGLFGLAWACRRASEHGRAWQTSFWSTGLLALMATLFYAALEIRRGFHGAFLNGGVFMGELYAYSLLLLAAAIALLLGGIWRNNAGSRRVGIAILASALLKLFLIDLAHLEGLWRAFAFLGLGAGLIFVGYAIRRWGTLPSIASPDAQTP